MLRNYLRNKTVMAAVSIAVGIFLIIARSTAFNILCRIAGYALLAAAVAYVLLYFFGRNQNPVQIQYAGVAAVAGLLLIFLAPTLQYVFPVLFGICLLIVGIGNLTATREDGFPMYSKVGPILTIIVAILIIIRPGAVANIVVLLAGIGLVINGLSELALIRRIW